MRKLIWVRHAPVARTGCYTGGGSDVPALLPVDPPMLWEAAPHEALWHSSPLQRAVQTAHALMAESGHATTALSIVPALAEQHFGAWEGRSYDDVWAESEFQYDWSDPAAIRPPGGESFQDVCTRVAAWLEQQRAQADDRPRIVVAHAGVIRAGLCHALGWSPQHALSQEIAYGSVTCVEYEW